MAKAFMFIAIVCALYMLSKHATLHVLVASPAATACVGYYLLNRRIAELVVEFVQQVQHVLMVLAVVQPLVYHLAMAFVAVSKILPAAMDNAPASQAVLLAVEDVAMLVLDLMMLAVVEYALLLIQLLIVETVAMIVMRMKNVALVSVLLLILLLPVVIAPQLANPMRDAALDALLAQLALTEIVCVLVQIFHHAAGPVALTAPWLAALTPALIFWRTLIIA
ncbi:hypothetical protein CNMCM5793_005552 [Aspergillus hiratsukae]|uniref:Uncharacterized protein n=1 Tax=Aspergillus hiratsukae TaxID=1194566 RepID=A0A8H6P3N1_9EURO|nr:hypothetical protein CNMCM5793_005552 [Aspergillus hiratsukae]KAF7172293.1 hypothetical protein CNMCM6106_006548 [Aspergillus hiratsukae]